MMKPPAWVHGLLGLVMGGCLGYGVALRTLTEPTTRSSKQATAGSAEVTEKRNVLIEEAGKLKPNAAKVTSLKT